MIDCRHKLYGIRDIYQQGSAKQLFFQAVKENTAFHRANNPVYKRMLDAREFSVKELGNGDDLHRIPPIPTMFFKSHTLWTMDPACLAVQATSSGTGGRKSQIGLDYNALMLGTQMGVGVGRFHGLFSPVPVNYLILGYQPRRENRTAISKTQRASMLYAPARHVTYALVYRDGEYRLDLDGLKTALSRYERQRAPVRLVGFPAYLYFLLKELKKEGKCFRFREGSMVMLGGGWKQFYREQPEKQQVYGLLEEVLGIREDCCREFFGAVEHPSMYCDCLRHHFHVPAYSQVIIRDVDTLEPLEYGKPGLVNLITPIADSMPLVSVMTDDLGILYPGAHCGCGIKAPYFKILGRAGLEEIRTCAAGAGELLRQ